MITIQLFPETFLGLFCMIFIITAIIYKLQHNKSLKLFYIAIIELYCILMLSTTLLPLRILPPELIQTTYDYSYFFQLIPFKTIKAVLQFTGPLSIQIIGNIVIFVPLPILIGYAAKSTKCVKLFLKSCIIPLVIESIQLIIDFILKYPSRIFDIDDIILNFIGILLGIIIYSCTLHFKKIYTWLGNNIVWESKG